MAVKSVVTTPLTWGSLMGRGNREPLDDTQLNYSYTDLLWELNQRKGNPSDASYTVGANKGGSGNFYVGLITSVPYVNDNVTDTKLKISGSHYTSDGKNLISEAITMKGPWYVSYCGTDTRYGNKGVGKYGFNPDGNGNTYYADRIVLRQEMDYALDKDFVRRTQLGTYYTGVGLWYDSYTKSKEYAAGKECPDGTYFPTTSYAEIFNDYTNNVATGNFSHAEGKTTTASGANSHAEGQSSKATGGNSHSEGTSSTASGTASHAEGNSTTASGTTSHAEGNSTTASGNYAHAEGNSTTASGVASHAEGYNTQATGEYAHAEGANTTAVRHTHAEGGSTSSEGEWSHAEGYKSRSGGKNSHAEGEETAAIGQGSHAEGYSVKANSSYSHAEGDTTTTNGPSSHAEGVGSQTAASAAHAEGSHAKAQGEYSHAEGNYTTAYGKGSHTQGNYSYAISYFSTAIGSYTYTYNQDETAIGHWNVSDSSNSGTLFTIGNGTSTDRHNVTAIYDNGDINVEGQNLIEHLTGYRNAKIDKSSTISIGTNETVRIGGTSDIRKSGASYEGYESNHTMSVTGENHEYSYAGKHNYVAYDFDDWVKGNIKRTVDGAYFASYVNNGFTYLWTKQDKTDIVALGNRLEHTWSNKTTTVHGAVKNIYDYTSYTCTLYSITDVGGAVRRIDTLGDFEENNRYGKRESTYGQNHLLYVANQLRVTVKDSAYLTTNNNTYETTGNYRKVHVSGQNSVDEEIYQGSRTVTVSKPDTLISNAGRTQTISNANFVTQVNNADIVVATQDNHDARLHARSTYIESVHAYIGDNTYTSITGNYSVGLGQGIKTSCNTNISVGKYNENGATYFSVGIGTADNNRKNAFWISQGTSTGYNGVAYFSNNTYVYANDHDPGQYPNNKEDKSWSQVVTYNMYRNSYTYLYKTMNDKFDTFGNGTYFTKSIDAFTYTPTTNVLHFTTQTFDKESNTWPTATYIQTLPQAKPGALENDNTGAAGLMSARDKARLDSIWEGDKQIAGIQISTGTWTIYKNDGTTTYTLANIKHQSNSITNLQVEYGFRPKWSGTWKWTVSNQKNAEKCEGTWGDTLPPVNTNSETWTSSVLSNTGQICYEKIYAAKRGLIISGYPDDYAASSNGSKHLGSIVPASGEDNRSCNVSWSVYRLLFYGQTTQSQADNMNISVISGLTTTKITGRSWTINYTATGTTCFVMAYPADWGIISTIKKNGVEIITSSFLKVGSTKYTNGAGLEQDYNIYRSGVGTASMSITIS